MGRRQNILLNLQLWLSGFLAAAAAFLRQLMTYDGSAEIYACRQVPGRWLADRDAENLAALILRSAQTSARLGKYHLLRQEILAGIGLNSR